MYILNLHLTTDNDIIFKIKEPKSVELLANQYLIRGYEHKIVFSCNDINLVDDGEIILKIVKNSPKIFAAFIKGESKKQSSFKAFYTHVEATNNLTFYFEIEVPSLRFPEISLPKDSVEDVLFIIPNTEEELDNKKLELLNKLAYTTLVKEVDDTLEINYNLLEKIKKFDNEIKLKLVERIKSANMDSKLSIAEIYAVVEQLLEDDKISEEALIKIIEEIIKERKV